MPLSICKRLPFFLLLGDFEPSRFRTNRHYISTRHGPRQIPCDCRRSQSHRCRYRTARYRWHPLIWTAGYGDSDFVIGTGWQARNTDEHWENYSIWFLCSQRNGELLDYFRRCRECNKWFFAVTAHQIYCSDGCRKRSSSHSEEFKNARREYMRKYRKQEKSRDRAAKERLKAKERSR